jgi:hypothetical protein
MNPAFIAMVLSMVEQLIENEPEIAAELKAIFTKDNPTPADWLALHQKVLAKTYADYVPASALPAKAAAAPAPPVTTADTQSNAPISQPGASAETENEAETQNEPETAAATVPAYLADGSKNPDHQG